MGGQKTAPNDAYNWSLAVEKLRDKGVPNPDLVARRLIAEKRRIDLPDRRTFAPGDTIPYDVTAATDLDGDLWMRLGTAPNERDMWRMPGFDPDEHESAAQGCQLTPFLLETYGPVTEAPTSTRLG